jgi:hypothetical protein
VAVQIPDAYEWRSNSTSRREEDRKGGQHSPDRGWSPRPVNYRNCGPPSCRHEAYNHARGKAPNTGASVLHRGGAGDVDDLEATSVDVAEEVSTS